jgi:hypothetical protein
VTKDEFTTMAASAFRHLLTAGAGAVAANGIAGSSVLVSVGTGASVFVATLAWSFIEKSALFSQLCAAAPASELEQLAGDIVAFRAKGSNPLLIAHLAQTVLAVAQSELIAAHPELAAPAAPPPSPAPVPSSPAAADPPPAQEPETPPLTRGVTP